MTNYMTKLKTGITMGAMMAGMMMGSAGAKADLIYNHVGGTLVGDEPYHGEHFTMTLKIFNDTLEGLLLAGTAGLFAIHPTYTQGADYEVSYSLTNVFSVPESANVGVVALMLDTAAGGAIEGTDIFMFNDPPECMTSLPNYACAITSQSETDSISEGLFDDDGNKINVLKASGPTGTWALSSTPAPSPEAAGLMLGGLGLMGFAALRRK